MKLFADILITTLCITLAIIGYHNIKRETKEEKRQQQNERLMARLSRLEKNKC